MQIANITMVLDKGQLPTSYTPLDDAQQVGPAGDGGMAAALRNWGAAGGR